MTRLGLNGYGVRPAGDYSGRGSGAHPVGLITRLGLNGYAGKRAGDFSGRTAVGGHPVGIITRLSPNGYGIRINGSFEGRLPSEEVVKEIGGGDSSSRIYHKRRKPITGAELYRQYFEAQEIQETSAGLPEIERVEVDQKVEILDREIQQWLLSVQEGRYRKMVETRAKRAGERLLTKQKAEAMILLAEDL